MNEAQSLWWKQAQSDFNLFLQLRHGGAQECHLLHYLQMATEKISKAYLWRSKNPPPKTHIGFVRFLKALLSRPSKEVDRIANTLGFGRKQDLVRWVSRVQPLAHALQKIAPAEAGNGPNAEYPWPQEDPKECPTEYKFDLWRQLHNTGTGRKAMKFIERAIRVFDQYA